MKAFLSLCLASLAVAAPRRPRQDTAPTVDLGYEVHAATVNTTGHYYTFSNIPYAQQPVGELRFQKPIAISGTSFEVNNGSVATQCMQAFPKWIIELQAAANGLDYNTMAYVLYNQAGQTESCLVLDVHVPAETFNNGLGGTAPILVWIHGGGFTYGSKTSSGSPAGLLARSELNGGTGAIIVTINYRLGMFGWLAGQDVTANLGLYDQRLALEWVKQYIGRFGGNANKVTVMGESAGASSILHHITGYGGAEPAPFEAAIPQSPAFQIGLDYETSYLLTLGTASNTTGVTVSNVDQLGDLDSETLKKVNQVVVEQAMTGGFNYGPIVDGSYVPKVPQVLLHEGNFDHSIILMTSHTSNESIPFVPQTIGTAADVRSYISTSLRAASDETLDYLLTEVYPDVLDGTYPWWSEFGRAAQINTEINFSCSSRYLNVAFANLTHSYIFAYPPGYHAGDVPYYFFNGDTSSNNNGLPVDAELAYNIQDYLVSFVKTGDPNTVGRTLFPIYGPAAEVQLFTYGGVQTGRDDMKNARCDWIQQALVAGLI